MWTILEAFEKKRVLSHELNLIIVSYFFHFSLRNNLEKIFYGHYIQHTKSSFRAEPYYLDNLMYDSYSL